MPKDKLQKIKIDISLLCENLKDITNSNSEFMFFVKSNVSSNEGQGEALIPSLPSDRESTTSTVTATTSLVATSVKYELVYNHMTNALIYKLDQIPNDIIMFIYESCFTPSTSVSVVADPVAVTMVNIGIITETAPTAITLFALFPFESKNCTVMVPISP